MSTLAQQKLRAPKPILLLAGCAVAWVVIGGFALRAEPTEEFRLRRERPAASFRSAGGEFTVEGSVAARLTARGSDFELVSVRSFEARSGAESCFCSLLFADGFESGDTNLWSGGTS